MHRFKGLDPFCLDELLDLFFRKGSRSLECAQAISLTFPFGARGRLWGSVMTSRRSHWVDFERLQVAVGVHCVALACALPSEL